MTLPLNPAIGQQVGFTVHALYNVCIHIILGLSIDSSEAILKNSTMFETINYEFRTCYYAITLCHNEQCKFIECEQEYYNA